MTDNEIIKAKEHFTYGITHDIFSEPVTSYAKTALWAFEEVNRQKAEIERLQTEKIELRTEAEKKQAVVEEMSVMLGRQYKIARAEAIKEFVESAKVYKIKGEFAQRDDYYVNVVNIEQLAEMECDRE